MQFPKAAGARSTKDEPDPYFTVSLLGSAVTAMQAARMEKVRRARSCMVDSDS